MLRNNIFKLMTGVVIVTISVVLSFLFVRNDFKVVSSTGDQAEFAPRNLVTIQPFEEVLHPESAITNGTPIKPTPPQLDYISPLSNMFVTPVALVGDLRESFDRYYDRALAGDPEAQYNLSAVLENCGMIDGVESFQVLDDIYAQAAITELQYNSLRPMIPDCLYFQSKSPDEYSLLAWASKLSRAAAKEGQVIARIRQLLGDPLLVEDSYEQTAALLQEAVLDGDFRAYYLVSDFFRKNRGPNWAENNWIVPTKSWQILACRAHALCDENILMANLEIAYLPNRLEEILNYLAKIESKIVAHEKILLPTKISIQK